MKLSSEFVWTDRHGDRNAIVISDCDSEEDLKKELEIALEYAKEDGWTPPRWWQWGRWGDTRIWWRRGFRLTVVDDEL